LRDLAKVGTFFRRRYHHNVNATTEPPGNRSSIAAYGAKSLSLAKPTVAQLLKIDFENIAFQPGYASIASCRTSTVALVAATARSPWVTLE
jgi:hypothetical protein